MEAYDSGIRLSAYLGLKELEKENIDRCLQCCGPQVTNQLIDKFNVDAVDVDWAAKKCIGEAEPQYDAGDADAPNDAASKFSVTEPDEDGKMVTKEVECEVWGGAFFGGKLSFSYTSCTDTKKSVLLQIKIGEMLGIEDCPMLDVWDFAYNSEPDPDNTNPNLIAIKFNPTFSIDACDLLLMIVSAGASAAAGKAMAKVAGKAIAKLPGKAMRSLSKKITKMANKQYKSWFKSEMKFQGGFFAVKKGVKGMGVGTKDNESGYGKELEDPSDGGMCDSMQGILEGIIGCIVGSEIKLPGLGTIFDILNKLLGTIAIGINFAVDFDYKEWTFDNWAAGFRVKWLLGWIGFPLKVAMTAVGMFTPAGVNCPIGFTHIAKFMEFGLSFVPAFGAYFKVTCAPELAEMFNKIKETLKEIGEYVLKTVSKVAIKIFHGLERIGVRIINGAKKILDAVEKGLIKVGQDVIKIVNRAKEIIADIGKKVAGFFDDIFGRRHLSFVSRLREVDLSKQTDEFFLNAVAQLAHEKNLSYEAYLQSYYLNSIPRETLTADAYEKLYEAYNNMKSESRLAAEAKVREEQIADMKEQESLFVKGMIPMRKNPPTEEEVASHEAALLDHLIPAIEAQQEHY